MVQRGDYVTPTFRGEPFLDKPILFFWAEAASLRLFGDRAAAVRIPPLLLGLLGMLAVALLGRTLFDEPAGLIGGIVYATMLLPMGVSEVAVHDIGLVPFLCIAALYLFQAVRRNLVTCAALAGIALGLSILTKGLVGVVFAVLFAVWLTPRDRASWLRLAVAIAIAIVVAAIVAAPWYVAMERAHRGYLYYYFVERHLQGYLTATQRHAGRPIWYYLPIVLGGALPWTAYLIGAARAALGAAALATATRNPVRRALWGWFGTGLIFLSIGESKLVTYALPLFPALAVIIGEYVSSNARVVPASVDPRPAPGAADPLFTLAFATHVLALALLPAVGLLILRWKFQAAHPLVWTSVVVLSVLTLDAGRRAARSSSGSGFMACLVGMTLYTIAAMMLVAPRAAAWMTSRDLAAALNRANTLPPSVHVVDERIGSLIFYLKPQLRAEATADRVDAASFADAMMRIGVDPPDAVFAIRESQLPRFYRLFRVPPAPDVRAGTFACFRADTLRTALRAP
jgi:4-amino-4-deoxy-L-arabinose transferase-like glycosyltransferase